MNKIPDVYKRKGVDSARGDDDFTPFRNIMNEYYAREDVYKRQRLTTSAASGSTNHWSLASFQR